MAVPREKRKETGALRWHGEPCQGKKQVNEVKQPGWAVPGVWKPEHFQAAVVQSSLPNPLAKEAVTAGPAAA